MRQDCPVCPDTRKKMCVNFFYLGKFREYFFMQHPVNNILCLAWSTSLTMPQYGLVALFLLAATSIDARVPAGLAMFSSDNSFRRPPVPPPRLEATCLQFPWLRRCQGMLRRH